jgi:hypothetical protein
VLIDLQKGKMTDSPVRTSFKRAMFWTAFILGTLILLFSFLLAQAPRGRNADFTLDYVCWSVAASLLVVSLVTAKLTWSNWNPLKWRDVPSLAQVFVGAARLELAFSIYGILSFATSR